MLKTKGAPLLSSPLGASAHFQLKEVFVGFLGQERAAVLGLVFVLVKDLVPVARRVGCASSKM